MAKKWWENGTLLAWNKGVEDQQRYGKKKFGDQMGSKRFKRESSVEQEVLETGSDLESNPEIIKYVLVDLKDYLDQNFRNNGGLKTNLRTNELKNRKN